MSLTLEDKFVTFEYGSSRVDPGPALILFQVENSKLITKYNPRDHPCGQLDIGECEAVRQYLQEREIKEVYSPKEILPMPEYILGLKLDFDNDLEWGLYRPLGKHYWAYFFSEVGIELKEFNPSEL